MSMRRTRLFDCNPKWVEYDEGLTCGIRLDCPEGHDGCLHVIPFTPALDGTQFDITRVWQRTGDTFETLTLTPSIRRLPTYTSRDEALATGALPEYLNDSHFCAFHGFIQNGQIVFCGDSR